MSIEDQTDVPLSAIAALVRGAIVADLGDDMIGAVYEDPRSLQVIAAGKLPALCVYRKSRKSRRESSTNRVQDIVVCFQYMLPATSIDKRKGRWPALDAVWDVIETAVLAGKHAAVSDGADVLELAATQGLENTPSCENGFADGGGESYPLFIGTIGVTHSPADVDWAAFSAFREFYAAFDGYENPDSADLEANPLTNDTTTLEGLEPP